MIDSRRSEVEDDDEDDGRKSQYDQTLMFSKWVRLEKDFVASLLIGSRLTPRQTHKTLAIEDYFSRSIVSFPVCLSTKPQQIEAQPRLGFFFVYITLTVFNSTTGKRSTLDENIPKIHLSADVYYYVIFYNIRCMTVMLYKI